MVRRRSAPQPMAVSSRPPAGVGQIVLSEPVGPVAGFTPWNFPINQAVRKISAALAAGCSIILKGPEETPASRAPQLVRRPASMPACRPRVVELVFGVPAKSRNTSFRIRRSARCPSPDRPPSASSSRARRRAHEAHHHGAGRPRAGDRVRRRRSSTPRRTMLAANKFRNAGQVCISPTRFLVQEPTSTSHSSTSSSPRRRRSRSATAWRRTRRMGPLANPRRLDAMEAFVADAVDQGREGPRPAAHRIGNKGYFFEPTVLTGRAARSPHHERGAVRPGRRDRPFNDFDDAISEANRLPYGLARLRLHQLGQDRGCDRPRRIESGMVSINHLGPRAARGAVRRRQGFGLRLGRRLRGDRGVSQYEVRHPAPRVSLLTSAAPVPPGRRGVSGRRRPPCR